MHAQTSTGIPGIPDVRWGTHYCHFYDSRSDLADILVPYFKAGLDGNDACLWVTSAPLRANDARAALAAVTPDLADREARGQIEIIDHDEWYLRTGKADAAATLQGWIDREAHALARGYSGLRLTGNTYWLERSDWDSFVAYEGLVNETFRNHRILGLCSYCFGHCSSRDVLDVVANHDFTVVHHESSWQVVESATVNLARQDLLRVQLAADALRSADARKDQFIAMLGHELRNPLAPIASAVELMRLRKTGHNTRELDIIERQLRQLTTLVDDLLDLSRITRGLMELRRTPVAIRDVLTRAIEVVTPLVEARQHRVDVHDGSEGAVVDGDANRLVQVFTNLLTNAAKYTPPGGELEASITRNDERVIITIRDNGPGISADVLPHVFEPFVQGERSLDRSQGGLGLGLPIVKSIVEVHHGTVAIKSSHAGTTATVALPLATTAQAGAEMEPRTLGRGDGRRVLVVDDNEDATTLLGQLLEALGYDVRVAFNAGAALAIVERWQPDIAILDIGLPGVTGYELAQQLRARSPMEMLQLIALTGYGAPSDVELARQAGFDHHLVKPVSIATIESLLGKLQTRVDVR